MISHASRFGAHNQLAWVYEHGIALLMGTVFTFVLFFGLSRIDRRSTETTQGISLQEFPLTSVVIAPPPPPQHFEEIRTEPITIPAPGLSYSPSESPVKLAVSPMVPEQLIQITKVIPAAGIRSMDPLVTFQPKNLASIDVQHVFQQSEVDRAPTVLHRVAPEISSNSLRFINNPRLVFLLIVNANGTVSSVRVLEKSDSDQLNELFTEAIKEWVFTPAIKAGKPVRCMIRQPVSVRSGRVSPFETTK